MLICTDNHRRICLVKGVLREEKYGFFRQDGQYIAKWCDITYDDLRLCCREKLKVVLKEREDRKQKLEDNIDDNTKVLKHKRDISSLNLDIKRIRKVIPES